MAKEATLQVRMDADVKQAAEALYRSLGTSLAEAVRIFAQRSVEVGGMPFLVQRTDKTSAFGIASKYANPDLIPLEEGAWAEAAADKHAKDLENKR